MKYKTAGGRQLRRRVGMGRRQTALILMEALEPRQLLSTNVLQWGGGLTGNAVYSTETTLTPTNVNSSQFGKLATITLPGGTGDQVYAQPLIVNNVNVTGQGTNSGMHNLVIVATEANNVYAFDTTTYALVWKLNVGTPIPAGVSGGPNANNIKVEDGITGTPVIDANSSTMYLDSIQEIGGTGPNQFAHKVLAINITDGVVTNSFVIGNSSNTFSGTPISVLGNVSDTGNTGSRVFFNPGTQLQRPGLTILNGVVYIAYGSYGNTNPYDGWILGFSENSLALTSVFCDTPNENPPYTSSQSKGSIWQSGVEITTDGTYLYVVSGNGIFSNNATVNDYGESALKLLPDSNTSQTSATGQMTNGYGIHIADFFAPWNANNLGDFTSSSGDLDLGTSGALLLPTQPGPYPDEEIMVSKEGVIYVVNRDNMGGQNAGTSDSQIIQELSLDGKGMWGDPTYFNGNVYFHEQSGVVMEYSLVNGLLSAQPIAAGSITIASEGATPVISYNGSDPSTAVLWEIDNSGVLRAYNPTTLQEIYDSNQNASNADKLGTVEHFSVPVINNGQVWVGGSVTLSVYGEKANPFASAPAAPTSLTVSNITGGQLTLSWSATASQNEASFLIQRSTNDVNFTQIGTAGIDASTYADTTAVPGTVYYYRVCASNSAGNSAFTGTASGTALVSSVIGNLYNFNATGGTFVADTTTLGANNGTLSGTTPPMFVAGYSGNALQFFGANGSASDSTSTIQGSVVSLQYTLNGYLGGTSTGVTGTTMDFWIKTTQTGNNEPTQAPAIAGVTKLNAALQYPPTAANTQDGGSDMRWGYINAEGDIGVSVDGYKATSNPLDTYGVVSTTPINDGQWHNVALTRNVSTGLLQVYVDGVLEGSFFGDTGTKTTGFNLLGAQIEENSSGVVTGHEYFIGDLDNLYIYNQVLSGAEIDKIAGLPPALVSAVSRKTQGSAGTFDINLPLTGSPGIEDRSGGPTLLVLTFANPVALGPSYSVGLSSGTAGTSQVSGSTLSISLSGADDGQTLVVTINDLLDANSGVAGNYSLQAGVLLGDINATGAVNGADITLAKLASGQPVTASNFRYDINADGSINGADITLTELTSGDSLAPAPAITPSAQTATPSVTPATVGTGASGPSGTSADNTGVPVATVSAPLALLTPATITASWTGPTGPSSNLSTVEKIADIKPRLPLRSTTPAAHASKAPAKLVVQKGASAVTAGTPALTDSIGDSLDKKQRQPWLWSLVRP